MSTREEQRRFVGMFHDLDNASHEQSAAETEATEEQGRVLAALFGPKPGDRALLEAMHGIPSGEPTGGFDGGVRTEAVEKREADEAAQRRTRKEIETLRVDRDEDELSAAEFGREFSAMAKGES